jgi:hypothetical protein
MTRWSMYKLSTVVPILMASGCALYTPRKDVFHDNNRTHQTIGDRQTTVSRQGLVEANIISNIRCQVQKGLYDAFITGNVPWIAQTGTAVSLNLTWDEMANADATLSYSAPINAAALFSLDGGISASAHSTRQENITFNWDNSVLLRAAEVNANFDQSSPTCRVWESGIGVESDLGIDEFIFDKATIAATGQPSTTDTINYPEYSTFQDTVTFVIDYGGNLSPNWKLTRFNVSPGSPVFGADRKKTSVVIITIGPLAKKQSPAGQAVLGEQARLQHEAAVFGAATASSIASQTR